jgi:hypothetical protein
MSPAAPANVHIKDRTHAGMQAVPALLASLHALSGHDDTQNAARAREEQAERDYQRSQARQRPAAGPAASSAAPREFRYTVPACIDATSAEISTWIVQSQAETRRLQGELATSIARSDRLRLDLDTKRRQEAPVSSAGPPQFRYKVHACILATSAQISTWIADSEAETRRLQALLATSIARSDRLRFDLDTKRLQEASS